MRVTSGNILADIPRDVVKEEFRELSAAAHVQIERIVSTGQATPPGQWFDQDRAEWVLIVVGAAAVLFEGESAPRRLEPGDYLHIPPHARHRVEWTDPDRPTVWLAIHYG